MELVKTTELMANQYAALMMDLPNCGGIQVSTSGIIKEVKPVDMWGTPSETHSQIYLDVSKHGNGSDVKVFNVNNNHNWLVRTR